MEIKNLHIQYQYFNSKSDLSDDDQILLHAAFDAKKGSHSPYSKFKVGAAVLLENGQIVKGSNQENASLDYVQSEQPWLLWLHYFRKIKY